MKFTLAANWKMNLGLAETKSFIQEYAAWQLQISQDTKADPIQTIFFPSALSASQFVGANLEFGAQNFWPEADGAYTGEISLTQFKKIGATWALVGHSERRSIQLESASLLLRKMAWAWQHQLNVIYCIGESLEDREKGHTETVLDQQIYQVYRDENKYQWSNNCTVAYEPVWAIGTGKVATPDQVQQTHLYIRNRLTSLGLPSQVPLLYGGSVKPENAGQLSKIPNVDGFLVGGASLKTESFTAIYQAVHQCLLK